MGICTYTDILISWVGGWRLAVGGRLHNILSLSVSEKWHSIELTELSCIAHTLAQYFYFTIYQTD